MSSSQELERSTELKRGINSRQLSMIAIGGAIATGLFFASGSSISQAGPGGALLAYSLIGLIVFFVMVNMGEMATQLPIAGSFEAYANRFLDPAWGFAFGWNYWFAWAITVAAEFTAGAIVIKYWFPNTSASMWAMIFFVLLMGLNLLSAKGYAESEYWFSSFKVVTVIVFLIVGVLMIMGVIGHHHAGFSYWTLDAGQAGKAPFVGGFSTLLMVFLVAGFAFQGTEIVGIAAAEAEEPEKTVPKAIKSVFWRILIFYVGSIFVVACLVPFNDPQLLGGSVDNIAASPFTLVFKNAGLAAAATIMNFIILTSVLSCGNSGLYTASRMLHAMALSGKAPKALAYTNKNGVPTLAIWVTGLIAALSFFTSMVGEGKIYMIFLNASAITGFIVWFGISAAHYRFRKAWIAQGRSLDELKFKSKWYPWSNIIAMIVMAIVIFGANIWVFQAETFSWFDFITNYAFVPIFLLLYLGYKYKNKTKLVPLTECDLDTK